MTKKILLVAAANKTIGGGERHVADLMRGFTERGLEVGVAAPAGGDLNDLAVSLGVPYFPAEIAHGFSQKKLNAVRRAIKAFTPDIVHAHGSRAATFARIADPKAAQRVVYTIHGIHVDQGLGRVTKLPLERRLMRKTARFITVCESDKTKGEHLGILRPQKTDVIYNGVELVPDDSLHKIKSQSSFRDELEIPRERPLVLHVGRANPQKDQATLLKAFTLVLAEIPSAILTVIITGDENEIRKLKKLAEELRIAGSIRWIAPRSPLAQAYAESDVFCLSSLWEGFPYTVIEAMNCGCPVVSTKVDGIPEAIESGVSGLLVDPQSPEMLARALISILEDPELASSFSRAARERVLDAFTLDHMLEDTIQVYETTLSKIASV